MQLVQDLCSGDASNMLNVSVASDYAPTHGASSKVKERLYDDLQAVIELLLIQFLQVMSYWSCNARVGGGESHLVCGVVCMVLLVLAVK